MRIVTVPLLALAALAAAPAAAQYPPQAQPYSGYPNQGYDAGDDDGGYYGADVSGDPAAGYEDQYRQSPPPAGSYDPRRAPPAYSDDERWSSTSRYNSADARTPPPAAGRQNPRTAAYAARVARWRARADACEAGDLRACQGPDR